MATDPARARDLRLRRTYGITSEQYEQMFADQGGHCAICPRTPKNKPLEVDHDHKTGLVRGLLCWRCNNRLLSSAGDNPELLRSGACYLENPPAVKTVGRVIAPPKKPKKRKRRSKETSNS